MPEIQGIDYPSSIKLNLNSDKTLEMKIAYPNKNMQDNDAAFE